MKHSTHLAVALLAMLAGCASLVIEDRQLGLHKASVFEVTTPAPFVFASETKGLTAPPLAGSGMPPMISHAVDEHLPLTARSNECLECHDKPQNLGKPVAAGKARPAPVAHYRSTDAGQRHIAGTHYNCMACHAPQADVAPLVRNTSN